MEQEIKKVTKVEELDYFPFKTFQEFRKALLEGIAQPGIDRGVALHWVQGGIYSPRWLRIYALILAFLPFIAAIGFVIYAVVSKSWLLLLALPLLLIGFYVFHPSSAMVFGPIRSLFIFLTFIGFIWSLFMGKPDFFALTITLLIIWYAQKTIYSKAVGYLTRAVSEHEDLLCILWQGRALNIRFYNGNSYWVDWKNEDGKNIHYKQ